MPKSQAQIALLRGINVGGRNKLPMRDLAALFESLGCGDVATYIQSGNVVFHAPRARLAGLATELEDGIRREFDLDVPVVLRTAAAWRKVVDANPFLAEGADPAHLHVGFLAGRASAAARGRLDPGRSATDRFAATATEVYLHCPQGLARTKLTNAYFDSKLETVTTFRNWKTTLKLLDMADA